MKRVCGSIIPRWLLASKVDILSTKTIKIKSENEIKYFHSTLEMSPPCVSPEISGWWLLRLDPTDISNSTWLFTALLLRLVCLEIEMNNSQRPTLGLISTDLGILSTLLK